MQISQINDYVKTVLTEVYSSGNIASFIYGNEFDKILKQILNTISCYEQGSGTELKRLKDYLGDTLPDNWEILRTNKLFKLE